MGGGEVGRSGGGGEVVGDGVLKSYKENDYN